MPFYLSPSVYPSVEDRSNIVPAVQSSVGALVGYSKRGPLTPRLVTETREFVELYGNPTPGNYLHYSALGFLPKSTALYVHRVVNGALYGGVEIKKDAGGTSAGFTAGEADPSAHTFGTGGLLAIVPPNPGAWNNDCAVKITNINASDYEFDIEFYEKDANGTYQLVKSWTVSRKDKKDGYGRNMYVGDVFAIGENDYFAVIDNTTEADTVMPEEETTAIACLGGSDGSAVTSTQINAGWDLFKSDEYAPNILINGGYAEVAVASKMVEVCEARRDCVAILDAPYGSDASALVTYRDSLNIDSSYAALYGSWLKIYDSYNDKPVFVPCSGHVGGVYAYTDFVSEPWYAPAGNTRGALSVLDLEKHFTKGERDTLYQAQVNVIKRSLRGGSVVWGQKNLQTKASALDRMNVRRLMITLEKAMVLSLDDMEFEFNDRFTRTQITGMLDSYLKRVQSKRGVYEYRVICSEDNNPGAVIDSNELHVDVYVKPARAAEFIVLRSVITRTDVNFDEVIGTSA